MSKFGDDNNSDDGIDYTPSMSGATTLAAVCCAYLAFIGQKCIVAGLACGRLESTIHIGIYVTVFCVGTSSMRPIDSEHRERRECAASIFRFGLRIYIFSEFSILQRSNGTRSEP